MLVLSRRDKERIRLRNPVTNEVIWVSVVRIGKDNVRVGVDADGWQIDREEIAVAKDKPATLIAETDND